MDIQLPNKWKTNIIKKNMKYSIYQVNNYKGEKISLFHTEHFLDIIDVKLRVSNRWGVDCEVIYLGDITI